MHNSEEEKEEEKQVKVRLWKGGRKGSCGFLELKPSRCRGKKPKSIDGAAAGLEQSAALAWGVFRHILMHC